MNYLKIGVLSLVVICLSSPASSQYHLEDKYQTLLESSETFNQYKVITKTNLDAFWAEAKDSLRQDDRTITELNTLAASQQVAIDTLTTARQKLKEELESSLAFNDSILFLGVSFTKVGYHVMVWGLIVVLLILGIIAYLMFLKSNKVTTRSKKDLQALETTYEEHKSKARAREVKLKRELQTAINKLEENRRGRS